MIIKGDSRAVLGQLRRSANKINRIARALNAGEKANLPELREALRDYADISNRILDALGKNHGPVP
jgi:hypothetical protein